MTTRKPMLPMIAIDDALGAASRASPDRFEARGKGLIDHEHGLDRCIGCGQLPPHEGCAHICPACAPPTGACDCPGCALVAREVARASPEEGRADERRVAYGFVRHITWEAFGSEVRAKNTADEYLAEAQRCASLRSPPAPPTEDEGAREVHYTLPVSVLVIGPDRNGSSLCRLCHAAAGQGRPVIHDRACPLLRCTPILIPAAPASSKEGGRHEP